MIDTSTKVVLIDDDGSHLGYLKERLKELKVPESQVISFDHPDGMPSLGKLGQPKIALLSDAHHQFKRPHIYEALIKKLHKEQDQLIEVDVRLGFRSSDIGFENVDNEISSSYTPQSPQRLSPEIITKLNQKLARNLPRGEFFEQLAKDAELRANYILMTKYQRKGSSTTVDKMELDRQAMSLLLKSFA